MPAVVQVQRVGLSFYASLGYFALVCKRIGYLANWPHHKKGG